MKKYNYFHFVLRLEAELYRAQLDHYLAAMAAAAGPAAAYLPMMFPSPADMMRLQQQQQLQQLQQLQQDEFRLREAEMRRAAARQQQPANSRLMATANNGQSPTAHSAKSGVVKTVRASPDGGKTLHHHHPNQHQPHHLETKESGNRTSLLSSRASPSAAPPLPQLSSPQSGALPYSLNGGGGGLTSPSTFLPHWTTSPVYQQQVPSSLSSSFLPPPPPSTLQLVPTAHLTTSTVTTTLHQNSVTSLTTTTAATSSSLSSTTVTSPLNLSLSSNSSLDSFNNGSLDSSSDSNNTAASETASRCMPYVPKPRPPHPRHNGGPLRTSTPVRPFVRPFEDDFSSTSSVTSADVSTSQSEIVVEVENDHLTTSDKNDQRSIDLTSCSSPLPHPPLTSLKPLPEEELALGDEAAKGTLAAVTTTNHCVELEDSSSSSRKPEDQDSDYESMASDSSSASLRRREEAPPQQQVVLCPSSGHLLPHDEEETAAGDLEENKTAEDKHSVLLLRVPKEEEDMEDGGVSEMERTKIQIVDGSPKSVMMLSDGDISMKDEDGEGCNAAEEKEAKAVPLSPLEGEVAGSVDRGLFREPGPEPTSREKLKYLRYFRLVTHSRKNGE